MEYCRALIEIHASETRDAEIEVDAVEGWIGLLGLEEPLHGGLVVSGAAEEFAIFLPDGCVVWVDLEALLDGLEGEVIVAVEVVGLGEVVRGCRDRAGSILGRGRGG